MRIVGVLKKADREICANPSVQCASKCDLDKFRPLLLSPCTFPKLSLPTVPTCRLPNRAMSGSKRRAIILYAMLDTGMASIPSLGGDARTPYWEYHEQQEEMRLTIGEDAKQRSPALYLIYHATCMPQCTALSGLSGTV